MPDRLQAYVAIDHKMRELRDREHVNKIEKQLKRGRRLRSSIPNSQMRRTISGSRYRYRSAHPCRPAACDQSCFPGSLTRGVGQPPRRLLQPRESETYPHGMPTTSALTAYPREHEWRSPRAADREYRISPKVRISIPSTVRVVIGQTDRPPLPRLRESSVCLLPAWSAHPRS